MNFYSIHELSANTDAILEDIQSNGEAIITQNGKPIALMVDIPDGYFDEFIQAVRQARSAAAMNEFYTMNAHPEQYKRYSSFREAMNEVLGEA